VDELGSLIVDEERACTGLALDESKQTDQSIKTVSIKTAESTLETVETTETFVAVETIEEAPAFESQAIAISLAGVRPIM